MMNARGAARTVLVADDTAFVRDRFQQALEEGGHRAVTAATGHELLAQLHDAGGGIDLILLDLRLPNGRGLRLLRAIQAIGPQAPVLVFSGTIASAGEVRELAALGVAGFVNEYAGVQHILPALAPHLHPDRHNRRRSPRVGVDVPVAYRTGSTIATAVALSISEGGLAIRTTNPPAAGSSIRVRFRLPRSREIDTAVRVVWTDTRIGMGTQFTALAAADRTAIGEFVQTHFFSNRKA